MKRAMASGMKASETNREQHRAMMMEMPTSDSQVENSLFRPKMRGTKMMIEVSVEATTAMTTSRVPTRAASIRVLPFSMWRKIDSRATTALSTSMPAESISPIIDSTLSVPPDR